MKNHFFFSYSGNKRDEVETIHEALKNNLNNITTIIEPFCGSSAFSFYIASLYPGRFNYILNDNNKYLIELYTIAQSPRKFNILVERIRRLLNNINNLAFICVFFKLRIYDLYYDIINYNSPLYSMMNNHMQNDPLSQTLLLTSVYGLYLLNLFWFLKMLKILYTKIAEIYPVDSTILYQYLCSFVSYGSVAVSLFVYLPVYQHRYLLDIGGIIFVSVASHLYHYDLYNKFKEGVIEHYKHPTLNHYTLLIWDNFAIHTRSFLILYSIYLNQTNTTIPILLSFTIHAVTSAEFIKNISVCLYNKDDAKTLYLKENFRIITDVLNIVSLSLDIILAAAVAQLKYRIPFLLVNIFMGLLIYIKPFNKLNHLFVHIMLIAQCYYLCCISSQ
jgi:hypothetical protein